MGVYLSSPITEKFSDDGQGRNFSYGASSMQGWRLTQEDAHNCLAEFDESTKTAMLAVYDGHGGSEVAEYCALHLPDYIKKLSTYKEGRLGDSLSEAFLGFDATLVTEEVVKELKTLANLDKGKTLERTNTLKPRFFHDTTTTTTTTPSSSSSSSSIYSPVAEEEAHDENEADMLRAEANIPIEELVAKYAKQGALPPQAVVATKKQKVEESPAIRSKKTGLLGKGGGGGSGEPEGDAEMEALGVVATPGSSGGEVNKITNGHADNENNLNTEKEFKDRKNKTKEGGGGGGDGEGEDDDMEDGGGGDTSQEPETKVKSSTKEPTGTLPPSSSEAAASSSSSSSKDSEAAGSSKSNDLPGTASSSSSSLLPPGDEGSSTASGSAKEKVEEKPQSSTEGPSGSGEPQPGGSGCSPLKMRSVHDFDELDEEELDEEELEGMMDEEEEEDSDLEETDDEYEGCDSSDENTFNNEDDDEEEEEEECEDDDDYDHHNMIKESDEPGMDSGCTAVVALLRDRELVVANAGDSRCVLCRSGKAVDLSIDHKPEDEEEKSRIEAAGGKVTGDGRVNGGLNLSRAIGDHSYKQNSNLPPEEQMITALPDIQSRTLDEEDEFLVLACDGIWNFMSSQEVVDFIRERLKDPIKQAKLSLICEEFCLAPNTMGDGTGCDNMTCLIINLQQQRSSGSSKRTSDQLEEEEEEEEKVSTSTEGGGESLDKKEKKNEEDEEKKEEKSEKTVKRLKLTTDSTD